MRSTAGPAEHRQAARIAEQPRARKRLRRSTSPAARNAPASVGRPPATRSSARCSASSSSAAAQIDAPAGGRDPHDSRPRRLEARGGAPPPGRRPRQDPRPRPGGPRRGHDASGGRRASGCRSRPAADRVPPAPRGSESRVIGQPRADPDAIRVVPAAQPVPLEPRRSPVTQRDVAGRVATRPSSVAAVFRSQRPAARDVTGECLVQLAGLLLEHAGTPPRSRPPQGADPLSVDERVRVAACRPPLASRPASITSARTPVRPTWRRLEVTVEVGAPARPAAARSRTPRVVGAGPAV